MDDRTRTRVLEISRTANAGSNNFFALVADLEMALGGSPVGTESNPREERIRFRADPSLGFSASDVSSVQLVGEPESRERVHLHTTFLGLTGSAGPLPSPFLHAAATETKDSPSYGPFLDVFHHRAISLLYRAYQDSHPENSGQKDALFEQVASVLGFTSESVKASGLAPRTLLRLAPVLATGVRSPEVIEHAVRVLFEADRLAARHFFGVQCQIVEFRGHQVKVDPVDCMRLGLANRRLGQTSTLGSAQADSAARFEVQVSAECREVPSTEQIGEVQSKVQALVRLFAEPHTRLVLRFELLPRSQAPAMGSALGKRSWLGGRSHARTITTEFPQKRTRKPQGR